MQLEGRVISLIEDDPVMGESLVQGLALEGCHVDWWRSRQEAQRGLRATSPDLVICDLRLPDGAGDALFLDLAATEELPPFMFITAYGDIDRAVSVMRAGAGDFVTKPFEMEAFIERARTLIQRAPALRSDGTLGVSEAMRTIEATLRRISDSSTPVLLTGETGVGKEVCARFLHGISTRSKEPFIAVNCAAIPGDVMERELFGYRGASGQSFHHGFAERARTGVLFLDEVSELALPLQAKLLRLVEARDYHRVGGEQPLQFKARVICSSNRDLLALTEQKVFRDDLFYRINAVTIDVPPLRARRDDIPWLIEHFMSRLGRADEATPRGLSSLAHDAALEHPWPGNVRELRNRIERAIALTRTEWIMPADLFPDRSLAGPSGSQPFATLSEARDDAERRQIERALKETDGHIIEAAALLGVSRTTLWEKMRRLGLAAGSR
jgi:DNA-binding NtrC family response regulator